MAANDEFESFRGSLADLDTDAEQRIRRRFEERRVPPTSRAATDLPTTPDDDSVVELTRTTGDGDAPPRHTRRVLIGVAAAVVLMVLIGVVSLLRASEDTADVSSSIDDVPLSSMAATARTRPDTELPLRQYLYLQQTLGSNSRQVEDRAGGLAVYRTERWADREGLGLSRSLERQFTPKTPGTHPEPNSTEPLDTPMRAPGPFFNGSLTYDQIRELPTSASELLPELQQLVRTDDSSIVADFLASVVALDITPPAVRAAAFDTLEQMGAEPIGRVVTYSGLEGVGYQGRGPDGRPWLVVVDPADTRILAFVAGAGTGDGVFTDAERFYEYGDQRIESQLPA